MSPSRSRSGGRRTCTTLMRKYRSSRKRPALTSAARGRLVAQIRRKSVVRGSVLPMRVKLWSCNTRSRLLCSFGLMSAISSRNRLPPSAFSK